MRNLLLRRCLAVICLLIAGSASAQQGTFKALYIYNFARYVLWPTNMNSGDFVVAVLGEDETATELGKLAQTKKVNEQRINIQTISNYAAIGVPHILFIPASRSSQLERVAEHFKGKPTLIIAERPQSCSKGATINYVLVDGKLKYEYSIKRLDAQGLKASNNILTLGISAD